MGVTFGLIATYAAPTPSADYTYLFAADQQPAGGPWIGAFAYAKASQGAPSDQTLAQLVAQMGGGGPYQHVGVLVLATAPDTTKNPNSLSDFRAALLQVAGIGAYGGLVLWLPTLGGFTSSAPQLAFQGVGSGAQGHYQLLPQAFSMLALGGSGRTLFMDGRNSRGPTLGAGSDQASLSLTFPAGANLPVSFGDATPRTPAITATNVSLPLAGAAAGCLVASGALNAASAFELGVQYGIVSGQALFPSGPMVFPVLDASETLAVATATLTLDPLGAGGGRSRLAIAPTKGSFLSAYRTAIDEAVALAPQAGGGFAATVGFNGAIYFAPSGAFALSVPTSTASGHALLCGLSGVEAITFSAGDLMTFQASAAGCFSMDPSATGGFSFTVSNLQPCAAATATVTAASATACAYRCEPAQAPFFSPDDPSQPTLLSHDGFTLKTLPVSPATAFPLIPYAAFTPQHVGPGAVAGLVQAFETGWAAPTRAAVIQGYPAAPVAGPTLGITPQGYIAKFDGLGGITSLSLADGDGGAVSFTASSGSLPDWLRDALLSPQCFLVASCATADFQQYVDISVAMSDWGFTTQPPLPSTTPSKPPPPGPIIAPGDYKSVLIVKSAQGTVVDLVASPKLWNGCALLDDASDPGNAYARLNDAATDPQGLMLSSWLSTYLAQALATWNNGTGPQGLETFCKLITDPDWCGFLCLNAPVTPGALPSDLDFLLAGVDPKLLMAHHLGCTANQVRYTTSYQQDSAFFGYVHYLRPGAPPGGAVSVPFVPSTLDYDFQLMRLEAVFENSALNSFSSMALLLVDTLFGDPVLPNASGPGPTATNAVIIDGVLQHHDGVGTYVFTTPIGMAATFYLSSQALDRTEIDRALVVQNPPGTVGGPTDPTRSAVTFQLAGWLGLLSAPIDLLSYAALPFSNLALRMEFNKADGGNKQFSMDLGALALTPLADAAVDPKAIVNAAMASANVLYRGDSLVASFPLRLTSFITNGAQDPSSMGFLPLPVKNAKGQTGGGGSLGASWSALQLDLPLGGSGSLDASGLIDATLLFAWTPGQGSGVAAISPFIKITGPGGADLSFNLEGIIKFGAKGILLSQAPDATGAQVFVLEFAGIGLTLFTKSFPPGGSTNLLVAGSANRTIGWFGAYVDPTAPPLGSGPSMGSLTSGGTI
ncbi:MAG: hypothetical protein JSR45_15140 [Proteobacteria bacterium]|nr:hypothetical protein [Pseudomonadota bacterium]